jgi:hypothetical protein
LERPNSVIVAAVIEDLKRRELKGLETYGTTMDRTDLSHSEWMQHLYEELLDAAVYLKKIQNGSQRRTDNQKTDSGNVEQVGPIGEADDIGAALRKISEGEPDGSGEGFGQVETEDEDSEGEDRLLICSTEIEAALNALSVIDGKDEMLCGNQERRMIKEINAMAMNVTYRAMAEIYQTVFNPDE